MVDLFQGRTIKYFLIISFPVVIILGNFQYLMFNLSYYQSLYRKLGVYQSFNDQDEVHNATVSLLGYFRGKNNLDHNFFSNQAQLHLADVKNLLKSTFIFYNLSLLTVLILSALLIIKKQYRLLTTSLFLSSIITLSAMVLLAVGLFGVFDFLFVKFHRLVFDNNLWMFPEDDSLIRLFPQQFFISFSNQLAANIILTSALIATVSGILIKKLPR